MYAAKKDDAYIIAAVDTAKMNPDHIRQVVNYPAKEAPGTIVVDQTARYLYLVLPGGKAMRYAVGVGPVARPIIAIINTWSDAQPCHAHFKDRVEAAYGR